MSFVAKWRAGTYAIIAMKNSIYSKTYSTTSLRNIMQKHNAETFKIKKFKFCEKEGVLGYTTVNYKFKPLDDILAGKNVVLAEPDRIFIKDSISIETPSPRQNKRFKPSSNANTSMEFDSE